MDKTGNRVYLNENCSAISPATDIDWIGQGDISCVLTLSTLEDARHVDAFLEMRARCTT